LSLAQSQIGQHALAVSAEAVVNTYPIGRVMEALGTAANSGGGAAAALSAARCTVRRRWCARPQRAASAGLPPIAWIDQPPAGAPGVGCTWSAHCIPAEAVEYRRMIRPTLPPARQRHIRSLGESALACTFKFRSTAGLHRLGAAARWQTTIQEQNGSYSGTGTLQASFADASGTGTQAAPVPIELKGWTMQSDGVTVAQGSFKASPPAVALAAAGLIGSLEQVSGTPGSR